MFLWVCSVRAMNNFEYRITPHPNIVTPNAPAHKDLLSSSDAPYSKDKKDVAAKKQKIIVNRPYHTAISASSTFFTHRLYRKGKKHAYFFLHVLTAQIGRHEV